MKYSPLSHRPRRGRSSEYSQRFRSHHCFCQNCQGNSHQSSPSRRSHSLGDDTRGTIREQIQKARAPAHSRGVPWESNARKGASQALLHQYLTVAQRSPLCGQTSPLWPYKAHAGTSEPCVFPSQLEHVAVLRFSRAKTARLKGNR